MPICSVFFLMWSVHGSSESLVNFSWEKIKNSEILAGFVALQGMGCIWLSLLNSVCSVMPEEHMVHIAIFRYFGDVGEWGGGGLCSHYEK